MKIVIQNAVRDPLTRELRREHMNLVTPAPVICGVHLAPRRSRTVELAQLQEHDKRVIADMIKCGVLRVFKAVPYVELPESFFRTEPAALPPAPPAPAAPPVVVETPAVVESPVVVEEEAEPSEPAADMAPSRRDELMSLKNAQLREILKAADGGSGVGLSKAELVDAILERSA